MVDPNQPIIGKCEITFNLLKDFYVNRNFGAGHQTTHHPSLAVEEKTAHPTEDHPEIRIKTTLVIMVKV